MRIFRDLPLRQKLRRVILPIVFVTGAVVLGWGSVNHFNTAKHHTLERLTSVMNVLALNSASAIVLDDRQAAQENLDTLRAVPDVVSAVLYTKDGQAFAKYASATSGNAEGNAWYPRYFSLSRRVEIGLGEIGRIDVRVDLMPTYREVSEHLVVMAAVIAVGTLLALFLYDRLLCAITGPLLRLTDTMGKVSKEGDYKLRAHKEAQDEVGALVDGFNDMLAGIETRDAELSRYRAHLQEEVAERTAELQQAKERLEASLTEKEELVRKLDELATHDGLTGLYNHRAFHKLLEDELARAKRFNRPVSLLMIDIDHFKRVNDAHGHQAGDAILRGLGNLLMRQARAIDRVCRYGGEEITVILPEIENAAARNIAERLRTAVEQEPFDIGNRRTVHVTVSIGLASWPSQAATGEALVTAADTALYAAKQGGRNRVCRYEKEMAAQDG